MISTVFHDKRIGDAAALQMIVNVEPQCLSRAGWRISAPPAAEIVQRLVPGLHIVGIQLLLIEQNHHHSSLIKLSRIGFQFRRSDEDIRLKSQSVQRIFTGLQACDGQPQPRFGQVGFLSAVHESQRSTAHP